MISIHFKAKNKFNSKWRTRFVASDFDFNDLIERLEERGFEVKVGINLLLGV